MRFRNVYLFQFATIFAYLIGGALLRRVSHLESESHVCRNRTRVYGCKAIKRNTLDYNLPRRGIITYFEHILSAIPDTPFPRRVLPLARLCLPIRFFRLLLSSVRPPRLLSPLCRAFHSIPHHCL